MRRSNQICFAIGLVLLASLGYPATISAVTFGPATDYPVGTAPSAVAVGDFNGDGKLDLAVANAGSNFVSILLGKGDGTFQPALMADAGGPQSSIAVGDFNGDGKLDILVNSGSATGANGPNGVSILLGNGDGTFQPPVQIQSYANAVLVAVGDFNLDGKLDFAVGSTMNGTPSAGFLDIFPGKGDGTFQAPTSISLGSGSPVSLVVGDFDGDGRPDLAVGQTNPGALKILLGNGDGTFQSPVVTSPSGTTVYSSLGVGDFNGDNKQDLAARVTTTRRICTRPPLPPICWTVTIIEAEVLLSNGDGTFRPVFLGPLSLSTNVSNSDVAVGDVNGDGKLDVALFQVTGSVVIDLGKGDGTFPMVTSLAAGANHVTGTLVDLNGDKLADVVSVNGPAGTVSIFLNASPTSGADLAASFTSFVNPVVQGQNAVFTAQATNFGPQDATGVILTIDLPANTTFVSAMPTQGSCTTVSLTVTCALAPLPSPSFTFATVTLTPTASGMDTISASVAANEPDLVPTNDMASATFTVIPTFTLTVMKAGAGGGTVTDNFGMINCGSTCSAIFPSNATAALFAAPDATSVFSSWSGACTGTDPNSCTIPMTANMTVTATFLPPATVPLTVNIAGSGGGTVTSTPAGINCTAASCVGNFAPGTTVNLKASAATGSSFANWSGACTGTNPNTCAVIMSAAESLTATFGPPPDFMLNLASLSVGVPSGSQAPDTITLNPQNGALNSMVSFTCSVSPALAECSFSSASLTLGGTPVTTTLNITALKPPGTASLAPQRPGFALFASLWLAVPGLILAGGEFGAKQFRKKKVFMGLLLVCVLGAGAISQSACGGGSSTGGVNNSFTPPGQYNVTVTATSGAIMHSQAVTLSVQ
jgi:uncharacterized repeat protein (TIGR01451 family)